MCAHCLVAEVNYLHLFDRLQKPDYSIKEEVAVKLSLQISVLVRDLTKTTCEWSLSVKLSCLSDHD